MLQLKIEERISLFFKDWEGTPYRKNSGVKGVGIDCGTFIYCFLNEMINKITRVEYKEISKLICKLSFESCVRYILFCFPHIKESIDINLEPGDIVIVRPNTLPNTYHAIIQGIKRSEFWHCSESIGVHKSSLPLGGEVIRIYRPSNKEDWI